jgi:hypothetical protein
MEKRKQFVFASLLVGGIFLLVRLFSSTWELGYWGGVLLLVTSFLVNLVLYSKQLKSFQKVITVSILPCLFTAGILFLSPLIRSSIWVEIILFVLLVGGFYISLLAVNVFVITIKYKTVPLYRAAAVTGFLLSLFVGFSIFNSIFSLKYSPWINGILVFGASFLIFYSLFWSTAIAETEIKDFPIYALVASLLVAEIAVAVSFWPIGVGLASLYLVSSTYVLGGLIQARLRERLFKRTFWEYISVGLAIFIALFLTSY